MRSPQCPDFWILLIRRRWYMFGAINIARPGSPSLHVMIASLCITYEKPSREWELSALPSGPQGHKYRIVYSVKSNNDPLMPMQCNLSIHCNVWFLFAIPLGRQRQVKMRGSARSYCTCSASYDKDGGSSKCTLFGLIVLIPGLVCS